MERELLLLGLLRHQEMHGYQLHEFINTYMASCTDMKKPTAYNLLEKMADRGWINATREQTPSHNRPPRTVYAITSDGEAAFQHLLRENVAGYYATVFPGSIGLAFLDELPHEETLALLDQRRTQMQEALHILQNAPEHAGSMQLVIDHQIHHLTSELNWLETLIHTRMHSV